MRNILYESQKSLALYHSGLQEPSPNNTFLSQNKAWANANGPGMQGSLVFAQAQEQKASSKQ